MTNTAPPANYQSGCKHAHETSRIALQVRGRDAGIAYLHTYAHTAFQTWRESLYEDQFAAGQFDTAYELLTKLS